MMFLLIHPTMIPYMLIMLLQVPTSVIRLELVDKYGTEGPPSMESCQGIGTVSEGFSYGGDVRKVVFKWQKMIGAVHYNIYLMDKKGGSEFLTKVKGNFFEHKGLEFDTEYCYQVTSVDMDGDEVLAPKQYVAGSYRLLI